MNKELVYCILPPLGWICWTIGGLHWKWVRRYVLPAIIGIVCYIYGITLTPILISVTLMCIAFSLGYGESKPYWYKFLVGCGYMVSTIPLSYPNPLNFWQLSIPFIFIITFWLSNWKPTGKVWVWKIVEGMHSLAITLAVSYILSG